MTFQALNAALSGLRVAQQQLNVISNNVSNVGTQGYTRKILPQSAQVINATGEIIGVLPETVVRNVDLNLSRDLWTQISAVSSLDVKASYMSNIQDFHGPPDSEVSIAAEIAQLRDAFSSLADIPDEGYLLQSVVDQAQTVAGKFNDFSNLVVQQRNDAQDDMVQSVANINDLLEQIAQLNGQIKGADNIGRSVAGLEDQRDEAIKALSEEIEISLFKRGDGVIVIQTRTGVQLADERAEEVFFDPGVASTSGYYPDSSGVPGVYVGGDPATHVASVDVTGTGLGGRLGGLIEVRDEIMPQYQAQIDELAHKLALRFDAQGLRLFTDQSGTIPADTPPDPTAGPPATSVTYVGFAGNIQVNAAIVDDPTLIQQGTYPSDVTIPEGSNEVIRRVLEFTFGETSYQEAAGTIDLNFVGPATDLQSWLGLGSQNNIVAGIDFSSFTEIDDGVAGNNVDLAESLAPLFPNWPNDDQIQITFEEARTGLGPATITLDLSDADINFPIGGAVTDALDQVIAEINNQIALAGVPAGLNAVASRNSNGQLVISSSGNVTIDASSFAGSMGTTAAEGLGLAEATYPTEDPYFDVQVGNQEAVRITIEPGDTVTDLVAKLEWNSMAQTGVPGLYVDYDALAGTLTLRPGNDDSNGGPEFGGDIRLIGGPFTTSGAVNPTLAALPDSVGIISALFGSFTVSGTTVNESSAIQNIGYQSETTNGSGTYVPFRHQNLGPSVDIETNIANSNSLIDFAQKVVNRQTQDLTLTESKQADEASLQDLLQRELLDESGVNIDEELANLIVIQTAYAAAARAVTAADDLFNELLQSI